MIYLIVYTMEKSQMLGEWINFHSLFFKKNLENIVKSFDFCNKSYYNDYNKIKKGV